MNTGGWHVLARHRSRLLPILNDIRKVSIRRSFRWTIKFSPAFQPVCARASAFTTTATFSSLPHYSALDLDKAAHIRDNPAALGEAKAHAGAKLVPVLNGQSLITPHRRPRAVVLELQKASEHIDTKNLVFLGLQAGGTPVFSAPCQNSITDLAQAAETEVTWVDLRREGPRLNASDAALLALAQALVHWNQSNAYSAATGEPMTAIQGGHARVAKGGASRIVYPRIDPAAIMLVSCGDYVLLGRQSRWTPGRYSCLAGFIEIGETLEMAVAREVKEEAGIDIDLASIRYEASQPWPFPQSLMIGFQAKAAPVQIAARTDAALDQLKRCPHLMSQQEVQNSLLAELALPAPAVDTIELEDARWFHLSWLERQLSASAAATSEEAVVNELPFSLPGSYALAHSLILSWTKQRHSSRSHPCKDEVESVEIDQGGTYKYVLLRLQSLRSEEQSQLLVRGSQKAGYHRDIVHSEQHLLANNDCKVTCIGGGRIAFDAEGKQIDIYGYSSEYDQAPHSISAALVQRRYPFHTITVSYSGY